MIFSADVANRRFPLKLASLLADIPEKKIRRDLSETRLRRAGAAKGFTLHETFYFSLAAHSALGALSRSRKMDLWKAITTKKRVSGNIRLVGTTLMIDGVAQMQVNGAPLADAMVKRYVAWCRGSRRITKEDDTLGGAVRFRGTRISVEHVGLLVNRGVALSDLKQDFPALSPDDFIFAGLYVKRGPRPGRPRKRLRFRKAG